MAQGPEQKVIGHSDQGSQFSSHDLQAFLKSHNQVASMSWHGNCHDNAAAEIFLQRLKRERIKRRIYAHRNEARSDVFDYIEMFTTRNVAIPTAATFLRYSSSSSISIGWKVSRKVGAIHCLVS